MLGYKVMQSGVQGLAVQAICMDSATGLTAAGTTQGTALELTSSVNFLATVASGSGVVLSSLATQGDSQLVYNGGVNPVKVYPPVGGTINGLAVNAQVVIPVRTACQFHCGTGTPPATQWAAVLSA